jgi:integrase
MATSGHVTSKLGAGGKKLWYARYHCPLTGKWRWEAPEGRNTKKNAEALLQKRQREIEDGVYSRRPDIAFSDFAQTWLEQHGLNLKPTTRDFYKRIIDNHLQPYFQNVVLQRIAPAMCQDYKRVKIQDGKVSITTINRTITVLKKMLKDAVHWGYINRSPAEHMEGLRQTKFETQILTTEQIQTLLEAVPDRYRPLYETAILTGMRQGEIFALRWQDVDLDEGVIHVRKTYHEQFGEGEPKSQASIRYVDMPSELVRILSEHKAHAEYVVDGETVPYNGDNDLVFFTMSNEKHDRWKPVHLRRQNLLRRVHQPTLKRIRKTDKDFPAIRFHDLRHSFGSLMVVLTGDVAYVSRQMGHSKVSTTFDLYAHPVRKKGAEKLAEALYPSEDKAKVVLLRKPKK